MTHVKQLTPIGEIAEEALALLGTGRQISPFSTRYPGFGLEHAYEIVTLVCNERKARGETPVGRKIGFTNRATWSAFGVSGPIWNYMFDSTVHDLAAVDETFALTGLPEPRIEPEIVLHLAHAPSIDMDDAALLDCIDWIAHGFEIVYSIFPGWTFAAADAVAAYGVHGALLLGPRHWIGDSRARWTEALPTFAVELTGDHGVHLRGHGHHVLGGPIQALRFLVQDLAKSPGSDPLKAGEIVTTGTLTEVPPAAPGQTWKTALDGIDMRGIQVRFR